MPVTLNQIWLHDASNPADFLRFYTIDRSDKRDRSGSVRVYAGGRRRVVTTPARAQNIGVTLRMVTTAEVDQLEEWAGTVLMYRDHIGRLAFGTFFELDVDDYKDRLHHDVTFDFVTSTFSIEV